MFLCKFIAAVEARIESGVPQRGKGVAKQLSGSLTDFGVCESVCGGGVCDLGVANTVFGSGTVMGAAVCSQWLSQDNMGLVDAS